MIPIHALPALSPTDSVTTPPAEDCFDRPVEIAAVTSTETGAETGGEDRAPAIADNGEEANDEAGAEGDTETAEEHVSESADEEDAESSEQPPADAEPGFRDLGLSKHVLEALADVGYEAPSPIQARLIPFMLEGRDVFGQAQTGTGKTAAFALPLLTRLDLDGDKPQILVMTPTRELAIQVAEAFKKYASRIPGFRVVPIYGGQEYGVQLRALRHGPHVIVGTPGRVMDHMERGTLKLDGLTALVLDEADEMLKMGFKEDIEWILDRTPGTQQIALFSATLPAPIRTMARKYLKNPEEIIIKAKTTTVEATRQRYLIAAGYQKPEVLARVLEAETYDAVLVFVRTRQDTITVSDKLINSGLAAAALNGDVPQSMRERIVEQLKSGKLNILVATDVAARGLDVDRISLVVNYDIPYDIESYVHRIGRTGRAGRNGDAILFVAPREKRMLQAIERATRQPIEPMDPPAVSLINAKRVAAFKRRIADAMTGDGLEPFTTIVREFQAENDAEPLTIAAALAKLVQGSVPLFFDEKISMPLTSAHLRKERRDSSERRDGGEPRDSRFGRGREPSFAEDRKPRDRKKFERELLDQNPEKMIAAAEAEIEADQTVDLEFDQAPAVSRKPGERVGPSGVPYPKSTKKTPEEGGEFRRRRGGDASIAADFVPAGFSPREEKRSSGKRERPSDEREAGMARYRVEVGRADGVLPGNLVGAIAGETGLDSRYIGRIKLYNEFSTVDLPEDLPPKALSILKNVRVAGRRLDISLDRGESGSRDEERPPRPRREESDSTHDDNRPRRRRPESEESSSEAPSKGTSETRGERPQNRRPPWSESPARRERSAEGQRSAPRERSSGDDNPRRYDDSPRPRRYDDSPRPRRSGGDSPSRDDRPRKFDDSPRPRRSHDDRPTGRRDREHGARREKPASHAGFTRPRRSGGSDSRG